MISALYLIKGSSQDIYKLIESGDTLIFTGSFTESGDLIMFDKGKQILVDKNDIKQVNQVYPTKFINYLSENNLRLDFSGFEPHWSASFKGDRFSFTLNGTQTFKIDYSYESLDTWLNIGFKDVNGKSYGIIKRIWSYDKQSACDFMHDQENYLLYEGIFIVEDKVYKGCGLIVKNEPSIEIKTQTNSKALGFLANLKTGEKLSSFFNDNWILIYHKDNRCDGSTDGQINNLKSIQIDSIIKLQVKNDGEGWACDKKEPKTFDLNFDLKKKITDWDRFEIPNYENQEENIVFVVGAGESDYLKLHYDDNDLIIKLEYRSEDPG